LEDKPDAFFKFETPVVTYTVFIAFESCLDYPCPLNYWFSNNSSPQKRRSCINQQNFLTGSRFHVTLHFVNREDIFFIAFAWNLRGPCFQNYSIEKFAEMKQLLCFLLTQVFVQAILLALWCSGLGEEKSSCSIMLPYLSLCWLDSEKLKMLYPA